MAEWPLVGRRRELGVINGMVSAAPADGVGGIVLVGPCGVGKTRLALEAMALAARTGHVTKRVTATRASTELPLGAMTPLLTRVTDRAGPVDDPADLVRRCVAGLAEAAGEQFVLVVDDAHLLDQMSALVVAQVVATRTAVVVMTMRSDEPAPDPLVDLWKDGLVQRMPVQPLSNEAVEELLPQVVGGLVDPAAAAELTSRSSGNALFLRELVTGALEDDSFAVEAGIWRLRRPLSPSERLRDLVEARLAGLESHERSLVELVAFGEPLGHADLVALGDVGIAESLERRGLLSSSESGRRLEIRLGHPIYGDVVRARIPPLRVRTIVRSLAAAVEATGARRREDVLRVASWKLRCGDADPQLLLQGASEARWRYDFPLAERLARAASATGAGFDAKLLAAELASLQGRSDQAEQELVELARVVQDDTQRARVALLRVDNEVVWAGKPDLDVLEQAEREVSDPAWLAELAAKKLQVIVVTDGPRACADAAEPLLDQLSGTALALAGIASTWALSRLGRFDAALELSAKARAAHVASPRPIAWYPWFHDLEQCYALSYAGRFEEAETRGLAHHHQALADRSPEAQGAFAVLLASMVNERGHVGTAAKRAREALALHQQLGRTLMVRLSQTFLAMALALQGKSREAHDVIVDLDALRSATPFFNMVDALQAQAWVAVAEGHLSQARRQLTEAAREGCEVGDLVGAAAALHGVARLGHAAEVRDELAALAVEIDCELATARSAHVAAVVAGDSGALLQASRDFEVMGAHLLAAEAAADAAVASRYAGQRREAMAAQRRAAILTERCEGPQTPALQSIEARVRLTTAEREAASLAAAGSSNRAIADQLSLSIRTIENRLQRVYDKLGLAGRTDLADALAAEDVTK